MQILELVQKKRKMTKRTQEQHKLRVLRLLLKLALEQKKFFQFFFLFVSCCCFFLAFITSLLLDRVSSIELGKEGKKKRQHTVFEYVQNFINIFANGITIMTKYKIQNNFLGNCWNIFSVWSLLSEHLGLLHTAVARHISENFQKTQIFLGRSQLFSSATSVSYFWQRYF